MIVKYRIMQSKWAGDEPWETWGIMYENHGSILKAYPILYSMMLSDPKEIKRHFDQNIRERQLSIANAGEAFGDYADRYRLSPEIYIAEGDSFDDIVADLEARYLGYKEARGPQARAGSPGRIGSGVPAGLRGGMNGQDRP